MFVTARAYAVMHDGQNLGQLECIPKKGQHFFSPENDGV